MCIRDSHTADHSAANHIGTAISISQKRLYGCVGNKRVKTDIVPAVIFIVKSCDNRKMCIRDMVLFPVEIEGN